MIKRLLIILMVLFMITTMISGCGSKDPLKGLNQQKMDSITIRTSVEGLPKQKTIDENQQITQIIDFLKNLQLEKLKDQTPIQGWSFWVTFIGWDRDIIFIEDVVLIDGTYYQTPMGTKTLIQELYTKIDED